MLRFCTTVFTENYFYNRTYSMRFYNYAILAKY